MKKIFKSKIFWAIIIILVIGGAVAVKVLTPSKKTQYQTQPVKRGEVIQTVSATGQVKSASEIELNFKNVAKISVMNAKVGDKVKTNQVLAQQKANELAINVSKARISLEKAQANLDKIKTGATKEDVAVYEAAVAKYQTDLTNAQSDLNSTKITYQQALDNEKSGIIIDINTAIAKANISLQKVYDTLNYKGNSNNLVTNNSVLRNQVENEYTYTRSEVKNSESAYDLIGADPSDQNIDQAANSVLNTLPQVTKTLDDLGKLLDYVIVGTSISQTELDTLKTTINTERTTAYSSYSTMQAAKDSLSDARLNYQTKVSAAQDAVSAAERNLIKAQADLAYKKAPARSEDISLYQAAVQDAYADLQLAQDRYDETIIKAPIDGVITEVNYEVGEQTSLTTPAIKMLATQNYEIEVDIPESDIVKIDLGNKAEITLDAFSNDDIFAGSVTKINPAQTKIQDVVYYRVTVAFVTDQPAQTADLMDKIKPGMTANIVAGTAKVSDVLIIPLRAVKDVNGEKTVQILENNQPKTVTVGLGLRGDEGTVEVKSGLAEGQQVITFISEKK